MRLSLLNNCACCAVFPACLMTHPDTRRHVLSPCLRTLLPFVLMQSPVPLKLIDMPGHVAISSMSPPDPVNGNNTLATYRYTTLTAWTLGVGVGHARQADLCLAAQLRLCAAILWFLCGISLPLT